MIEPTDEMREAFRAAAPGLCIRPKCLRLRLAAVLALVALDQAGPCSVTLQLITSGGEPGGDLWCQLRHGHLGDHENGITRWKLATPPQ